MPFREGNIKADLEEFGLEAINCITVVQSTDRWRAVVDAEMNLHGSIVKFLTVGNCEVWCGVSRMVERSYWVWLNVVKFVNRLKEGNTHTHRAWWFQTIILFFSTTVSAFQPHLADICPIHLHSYSWCKHNISALDKVIFIKPDTEYSMDWHNAVGIATGYGLDGPGIESLWRGDFPHPSRPALGPTQHPV